MFTLSTLKKEDRREGVEDFSGKTVTSSQKSQSIEAVGQPVSYVGEVYRFKDSTYGGVLVAKEEGKEDRVVQVFLREDKNTLVDQMEGHVAVLFRTPA